MAASKVYYTTTEATLKTVYIDENNNLSITGNPMPRVVLEGPDFVTGD